MAAATFSSCRWMADRDGLLWRQWDPDEQLVYHLASGDTHLLHPLAAETLQTLECGPQTLAQLATRVAQALERDVDAGLREQLEALLVELAELGLVRSLP